MPKKYFYVLFTVLFLGGTFVLTQNPLRLPEGWGWLLWGAAALRLGRLCAFDKVMEAERSLLGICTVKDGSGMGESTESKGDGLRGALGDLICCPTCVATWGMGLLLVLYQVPALASWVGFLIVILALTAVTDAGQAAIEFLEGLGQLGREWAGDSRCQKEKP